MGSNDYQIGGPCLDCDNFVREVEAAAPFHFMHCLVCQIVEVLA